MFFFFFNASVWVFIGCYQLLLLSDTIALGDGEESEVLCFKYTNAVARMGMNQPQRARWMETIHPVHPSYIIKIENQGWGWGKGGWGGEKCAFSSSSFFFFFPSERAS